MKVTFRTVSGESFALEVEASTIVADLKAKVAAERSLSAETLKLVYKGKVLTDEAATLDSQGVTEQGFIVLFVQPPKAAPKPAAAAEPAAGASQPAAAKPVSHACLVPGRGTRGPAASGSPSCCFRTPPQETAAASQPAPTAGAPIAPGMLAAARSACGSGGACAEAATHQHHTWGGGPARTRGCLERRGHAGSASGDGGDGRRLFQRGLGPGVGQRARVGRQQHHGDGL